MNREIKFRAWNKKENKIYSQVFQLTLSNDGKIGVAAINELGNITISSEDFELMQFTGIKDENEKEIYEGDIVKNTKYRPEEIKVVFFYNWMFGSEDPKYMNLGTLTSKNSYSCEELLPFIPDGCEVIGNIYENPELIK